MKRPGVTPMPAPFTLGKLLRPETSAGLRRQRGTVEGFRVGHKARRNGSLAARWHVRAAGDVAGADRVAGAGRVAGTGCAAAPTGARSVARSAAARRTDTTGT